MATGSSYLLEKMEEFLMEDRIKGINKVLKILSKYI